MGTFAARHWLTAAFAVLLVACTETGEPGLFEISAVDAHWDSGVMDIRCVQRLRLSDEARAALESGVPLTVELEFILRDADGITRVADSTDRYEIRYLPLSRHYQVTFGKAGLVRTFPRLRHVLADLADLNLTLATGPLPEGDYELLARSRLDRDRLPPPMRLPVMLSSQWNHDSAWTSWPLVISSRT